MYSIVNTHYVKNEIDIVGKWVCVNIVVFSVFPLLQFIEKYWEFFTSDISKYSICSKSLTRYETKTSKLKIDIFLLILKVSSGNKKITSLSNRFIHYTNIQITQIPIEFIHFIPPVILKYVYHSIIMVLYCK